MAIDQAFNRSSQYYDDWVKKAVPCYEEVFSIATALVPFDPGDEIRVLDLGAGTGLFSEHILQKFPHATFVLYDVASEMLDVARDRFKRQKDRFQFVVDDYRNIRRIESVDLVISSLSIHHLDDEDKKDLFGGIYHVLKNSGAFINIDQIRGETEHFRQLYWSTWLEKVRQAGAKEQRIQDSIERRRKYDKDSLLSDQLLWLHAAGFANADCVYKNYFIGLFLALKP
jgi:tRNA (cmo5U34)-methyltransferase